MFLRLGSEELDCHSIYPEWHLISDYALLIVIILIFDKNVQTKKHMIVKDSDKENNFIAKLIVAIRGIDTNDIWNIDSLKDTIQSLAYDTERIWAKNSKIVNITKYSKSWWDMNCNRDLEKYRSSRHIEDWEQYKKTVKTPSVCFSTKKSKKLPTRDTAHGNS